MAIRLLCPSCKVTIIDCDGIHPLPLVYHDIAIPYDDWPLWARTVAALKIDADIGVGDTVERMAASMGGVAFKAWAKTVGIDCGCDARKASWNKIYPYA